MINKKLLIASSAGVLVIAALGAELLSPSPYMQIHQGNVYKIGQASNITTSLLTVNLKRDSVWSSLWAPKYSLVSYSSKSTAANIVNSSYESSLYSSAYKSGIVNAEQLAHQPLSYTLVGAEVIGTTAFAQQQGLGLGSVIYSINNKSVTSISQVTSLAKLPYVTVSWVSGTNASTKTISYLGKLLLEPAWSTNAYTKKAPKVAKLTNVGGPSGGAAVFTAATLDYIAVKVPKNLHIAATGVMDSNGNILSVSGINEKIKEAEADNISILFIPIGDFGQLNSLPNNMAIVPVSTAKELYSKLQYIVTSGKY